LTDDDDGDDDFLSSFRNFAEIRRTFEHGLCYQYVSFDVLMFVSVRTTVSCNQMPHGVMHTNALSEELAAFGLEVAFFVLIKEVEGFSETWVPVYQTTRRISREAQKKRYVICG
jgi:hypothetical protein